MAPQVLEDCNPWLEAHLDASSMDGMPPLSGEDVSVENEREYTCPTVPLPCKDYGNLSNNTRHSFMALCFGSISPTTFHCPFGVDILLHDKDPLDSSHHLYLSYHSLIWQ